MRMARVNVYLPDDLAEEVRRAGLNVSGLTQDALRSALAERRTRAWLDGLRRRAPAEVSSDAVAAAVRGARAELGDHDPDA